MDLMTKARSQWDRLLALAAAVAGAIVLITGWLGVSRTAYPAEQLPYIISAGLGGLFLLGISSTLWLSADLHDEWRKLDRIEQAIRSGEADGGAPNTAGTDFRPVARDTEPDSTREFSRVSAESAP
jgi:hypothetical protein